MGCSATFNITTQCFSSYNIMDDYNFLYDDYYYEWMVINYLANENKLDDKYTKYITNELVLKQVDIILNELPNDILLSRFKEKFKFWLRFYTTKNILLTIPVAENDHLKNLIWWRKREYTIKYIIF